ncbi:MAG: transposase [Bacteroidota bacterium]
MVRERPHRLDPECYQGYVVVAFTACLKNRVPFFNKRIFEIFEDMLLKSLAQYSCGADVYLFMPDHVHFIVRGETKEADTRRSIDLFKQYSGFWLSRHEPSVHWQKDYYDHILRSDESVEKHMYYILNNPVRAGLVTDWKAYKLRGSTKYDLDSWD